MTRSLSNPVKKCKKGKHLNKKTNRCNKDKKKKPKKKKPIKKKVQIYQKQSQKVIVHIHDKPKPKRRRRQLTRTIKLRNSNGISQQMIIQPTPNTTSYQRIKTQELQQKLRNQELKLQELTTIFSLRNINQGKIPQDIKENNIELKRLQKLEGEMTGMIARAGVGGITQVQGSFQERLYNLLKKSKPELRNIYLNKIGKQAPERWSKNNIARVITEKDIIGKNKID